MLIDLPTALRLVNASNPTVGLARERVNEAYARLRQAEVWWLPNLRMGPSYQRHDGQIQNSRGEVFPVSRSSLFAGGAAVLNVDTRDALYGPLMARQLVAAQAAQSRAVNNDVQLEAALTYLELLRVYGQLAINADRLARVEEMLRNAQGAAEAGLSRYAADINRARTELEQRRRERIDLEGDAGAVSARLAQLLLLPPAVDLRPAEPTVVPVRLVATDGPIDDLVATALMNRPELAASRALVEAALARWRRDRIGPLLPRLEVGYIGGTFGGGRNDDMSNFDGRGDGTAQLTWELRNLGVGDVARARAGRSQYNQANFQLVEVQARVGAEVASATKQSRARERALADAQEAVRQALETWRKLRDASFGLANPRERLFDALQPLIAEQALAQARTAYLNEVIEFNRAQFRLYTALGCPAETALPQSAAIPLDVPAVPPPPAPAPAPRK